VVNHDDRQAPESHSRLDLAGRLLRPHRNLFRGNRPSDSKPETRGRSKIGVDGTLSAPHAVDVICGGMYRACSTWQYEVVAHLIEQHLGGQRLGYLTGEQYAAEMRSDASVSVKAPRQTARWRVVKSHDRDRSFARAVAEEGAAAIYAYRDVREVVFSLMHKRGMTFEQLLRAGMIHQILSNDRFWMAQPDVLIQRYEDLLADPARGVAELARHLGIRIDESEATRIAEEYSHESNKARTESLRRRLEEAGVNLDNAANLQICDSTTLLHWNHIRQGNARSWHTLAIARQRMILERLAGRWLKARGYPPDPNPPARISLQERLSVEVDLMVACTTFLVRSGSQRFPQAARLVKHLLGIRDTQAGATAWADSPPTHSKPKRTGEPHISFTAKPSPSEQDVSIASESDPLRKRGITTSTARTTSSGGQILRHGVTSLWRLDLRVTHFFRAVKTVPYHLSGITIKCDALF
jgi:hypothetical protein